MKKLVIHMGVHRAASTALQSYLNVSRDSINISGAELLIPKDLKSKKYRGYFSQLKNYGAFDPRKLYMENRLLRALKNIDADTVILSSENLIGTMPGQDCPIGFYPRMERLLQTLRKWQSNFEIYPRIIVRSQDKWVESLYAFRVFRGLKVSFREFVESLSQGIFDWNHLRLRLTDAGLGNRSRFMVLEMLRGKEFSDWVPEFLELNPAILKQAKPKTNETMLDRDMALFWALNQAGWGRSDKKKRRTLRAELVRMSHVYGDRLLEVGEVENYLREAGIILSTKDFQIVETAYHEMPSAKFDDVGRESFLSQYRTSNEKFLRQPDVIAHSDIWG